MNKNQIKIGVMVKLKGLTNRIGYIYKIDKKSVCDVKVEWADSICDYENHKNLEIIEMNDLSHFIDGYLESNGFSISNVLRTKTDSIYLINKDYVKLTERNYNILVKTYGQEITDLKIEQMDNYCSRSKTGYHNSFLVLKIWIEKEVKSANKVIK